MQRGEVWWAVMNQPAGERPVVLLSRDEAYIARSLVIVAPVTTRVRNIPAEVPLTKEDGMPQECVANLDVITTIPKDSLRSRIAVLSAGKLKKVDEAIHFALGLEK